MFEEDNVYSVLKTQLFITRLFGLTPFKINSNGPQECKFALSWSIILLVILGGFSLFALISREQKELGIIMKIGDALNVYLNVVSMCCVLIYSCVYRKTIMNEIRRIYFLDSELQKFNFISNIHRSYNQSRTWILLGTSLLMLYLLALLILNIITYGSKSDTVFVGTVIAYVFPNVVNTIMELQFCTMVLLLRRRFCWLNGKILEIGNILKTPHNGLKSHCGKHPIKLISGTTNDKYTPQEKVALLIGKAKVNHQRLCTTSKQINKAFSVQILMLIVTTFLNCVVTLFYWAIKSTTITTNKISYGDKVYLSNGFGLAIMEILVIVVVCSITSAEARRTGSLIHDILPTTEIMPNKRALQIQLSSFSLQLAQYNVEFNACSVFPINETLLYSIVGAASAYLVIVIQFELSNRGASHTTYNSTPS